VVHKGLGSRLGVVEIAQDDCRALDEEFTGLVVLGDFTPVGVDELGLEAGEESTRGASVDVQLAGGCDDRRRLGEALAESVMRKTMRTRTLLP
jgi:hypothetical protein